MCIREVMEGDRANELKRNAVRWTEFAKEAVDEGGSSDKHIDEFISELAYSQNAEWFPDTGATSHVTDDSDLVTDPSTCTQELLSSNATATSAPIFSTSTDSSSRVPSLPLVTTSTTVTHGMTTRSHHGISKPNPKYIHLTTSSIPSEPKTVVSALKHPGWKAAMEEEMKALALNHTWDLLPRSSSMNVIGCRWIFKTKIHSDGRLDRLKARLVAKGYSQEEGVDFTETFSPMVKRILRYVRGTLTLGMRILAHSSLDLYAFSDSDWAGCRDTRRSTNGFCTFLGSNCITWSAKKQSTVTRSSAEAEYRALASTTAELTWLSFVLRDIGVPQPRPSLLFCDNLAALYMTVNPMFHCHTKHVEIDYHYVREKVALGSIITRFVTSKQQVADIFTKPLSRDHLCELRIKLGLSPSLQSSLKGSIESSDNGVQIRSQQTPHPAPPNKEMIQKERSDKEQSSESSDKEPTDSSPNSTNSADISNSDYVAVQAI
ncbi:hypothetical protein RJ640_012483 [Escallonia rubra]|uniref:Reverse transcriptase Ty1/copia-type domain-containing protein n=1 Tax=Escallonia rubra TaxID=112253 RepID=A0AA88R9B2_9ASTE|nr:hypothetical protein RJ640_012483 [Escallonia rubra]